MWKKYPTRQPSSTPVVAITSFRLSAAVADSVVESMRLPSPLKKKDIHSFTAMEASSTPKVTAEKVSGWGEMIFSTEDCTSEPPISRINAATTSPDRYSYRAWP